MNRDFPQPTPTPLSVALRWGASPDWTYEQKRDGIRALLSEGRLVGRARTYRLPGPIGELTATLDGELCGEVFWVFDILTDQTGTDIRALPLWRRRQILSSLEPLFPGWIRVIPWTHGSGGALLEKILATGGEGVVAKHVNGRYGFGWLKAKRLETHDCIVTAIHEGVGASVSLGQYQGAELVDCGRCPIAMGKLAQVSVGSVVEVACHSRTEVGKFREPRLVRVREDKPAEACLV